MRPLGRSGLRVGAHSFGGAQLGNLGRSISDEDADQAVRAAWDQGVRYFDTAPHYGLGLSEVRLGRALAQFPRNEYIVSTKVGRVLYPLTHKSQSLDEEFVVPKTHQRVLDYSRDGVLRSLDESLRRLGAERIDIVLVHDPDQHFAEAMSGAFPALDELRRAGVIQSYGAGMNQASMLQSFVENTDLDIVMLANQHSLLRPRASLGLLDEAERRNVSVVAAGVFNSGILAQARPDHQSHFDYKPASDEVLAAATNIANMCDRYQVPLPAAAAQFSLRHQAVATVCLGSRMASQVRRNDELFQLEIPDEFWREFDELPPMTTSRP